MRPFLDVGRLPGDAVPTVKTYSSVHELCVRDLILRAEPSY